MTIWRTPVLTKALATLKRRLPALPPRHPDRKEMMVSTCRPAHMGDLKRAGLGPREIVRTTGMSCNTVRRWTRAASPLTNVRPVVQ